jgi:hypothetical protein
MLLKVQLPACLLLRFHLLVTIVPYAYDALALKELPLSLVVAFSIEAKL